MNHQSITSAALALVCFTVSGFAADTATTKVVAGDPNTASRTVSYHKGEFISIPTQVGYPTLVELPTKEKALTQICGTCKSLDDKSEGGAEDWMIQIIPDSNLVAIQPLRAGVKTVAHVLGTSGTVYTFALTEISRIAGAHADVRVSIGITDSAIQGALVDVARFVSADKLEASKLQAAAAEKALEEERAKDQARQAKDKEAAREKAEAGIKHSYQWDAGSKADRVFNVKSMYESDGFTVIEAAPLESPAVYEKKDGKDSLIEYTLQDGRYVIPKIVSDGYLRVGKSKLTFHREG